MNNDVLVFDIETQNFFTDLGVGWNNFGVCYAIARALFYDVLVRFDCVARLAVL
jgi:hypothetical protein